MAEPSLMAQGADAAAEAAAKEEAVLAAEVAAALPYFPYKKLERFYDISGILAKPHLFDSMCALIAKRACERGITKIVAFEACAAHVSCCSAAPRTTLLCLHAGARLPVHAGGDQGGRSVRHASQVGQDAQHRL